MRALVLAAIALALALPGPRRASAVGWNDDARLRTREGTLSCPGERYWIGRGKRTFWTRGDECALTYIQCLQGYVEDADGIHKVLSCSPDIDNSRGRKAEYK